MHECRHTFVSLMADAGISLEEIRPYVGHSSTYMTERYRHLVEGHEDKTRDRLDAYLARADTAARLAQVQKNGVPPRGDKVRRNPARLRGLRLC